VLAVPARLHPLDPGLEVADLEPGQVHLGLADVLSLTTEFLNNFFGLCLLLLQ
jgi:hypothetical protein